MPAVPVRIGLAFRLARYVSQNRGRGLGRGKRAASPRAGSRQCASELMKASAKPNKPKSPKVLIINKIAHKSEKQTHGDYQPLYQSLTAILGPILRKFGWNYERSCDVL